MKILWFANNPCSAVEKLGMKTNAGGWLKSLEEEINKVPEIELAICFYSYQNIEPFIFNGTQYYPVHRKGKKNKINRLIKRFLTTKKDDELEVKELLKIIEIFKPDLIHVHGTEDNFGLVQFYTKTPLVISIQGILNPYAEKYFTGIPYYIASHYEGFFSKLAASGIERSYKQFNEIAEREKQILRETRYIIGRTDWDKRVTRVLAPNSNYYVGNEILRSSFYKNAWSKKQFGDTLQIVTTSSNAFYKGFESIVNTAQILKDNSEIKFVWKVIGLYENSYIVKIVEKWKNVNFLNLNIQFLGNNNENEIIEVLLASDLYCQTSHIENSPNSLCEAMILGMPIIATSVGGSSSLLKDKAEGILVQDGDSYSLAGAIIELANDFLKANKFGKAARIMASYRHNRNSICKKIIAIYTEIE